MDYNSENILIPSCSNDLNTQNLDHVGRSPLLSIENTADDQQFIQLDDSDDFEDQYEPATATPARKKYEKTRTINSQDCERRAFQGKYCNLFDVLFDNDVQTEFLACKKCNYVVAKKNRSCIIKHKKLHFGETMEMVEKKFRESIILPGLRGKSFDFVNSPEFLEILTNYGQLSIKYAEEGLQLKANTIIPSRHTIGRQIRNLWMKDEIKQEFNSLVQILVVDGAISFDFGHNVHDFFVITGHVLNKKFELQPFILNFNFFNRLGIENSNQRVFRIGATTDEGSNLIPGTEGVKRTTAPFEQNGLDEDEIRSMIGIKLELEALGRIINQLREYPEIDKARLALKPPVSTRWLTHYTMANALILHRQILAETIQQHGTDSIKQSLEKFDWNLLEKYVKLFGPFHEAVKILESAKRPTINLVLMYLAEIEEHLMECKMEAEISDDQLLFRLAKSALEVFDRKIKESINFRLVYAAAYLDPTVAAMMPDICQKIPRWDLENWKESVRYLSEQHRFFERNLECQLPQEVPELPRPKKRRFTSGEKGGPDIEKEMKAFELINVGLDMDPLEYDLLQFWHDKGGAFPLLHQMARKILCIPASSAHAERSFSHLRRIRSDFTRASLTDESISAMICCGSLKFFDFSSNNN